MLKNQHIQDCHELFNNHFFNGELNSIKLSVTDYIELYGFTCWGYYDGETKPNEIMITNNGKIYLTLLHDFKRMARFIEITLNIKKGSI